MIVAAVIYAAALVIVAARAASSGYLVGMAIGGLGFGMYMAVDLALVVDVLPDPLTAAKDLGVLNIAGALPFALAPAVAPGLLARARQLLRPVRRSRSLRPGRGGCSASHSTGCVELQQGLRSTEMCSRLGASDRLLQPGGASSGQTGFVPVVGAAGYRRLRCFGEPVDHRVAGGGTDLAGCT